MDVTAPGNVVLKPLSTNQSQAASKPADTALASAIPRMYGYFYPRVGGDRAAAEDLTQETLLAAVRSAAIPQVLDELMPWLFTIARNKLIDHYRKHARKQRNLGTQVDVDDVGIQPGLPDLDLESLPIRDEIITTLSSLNPKYRAAIVLRYFDGCDVATVAEALFLSHTATESLLARARNAFRATWIARNGDES